MKRSLLMAIAAGLVLLLPIPAFACTPVPAKTWTGTIEVATPKTSISNSVFSVNGCKWPDPTLNGVDALVLDVSSHGGLPGKLSWSTDAPVDPESVYAVFRTATCALTGTMYSQAASGKAINVAIPSNAKYLILQPVTDRPSAGIEVTVTSAGRKCK